MTSISSILVRITGTGLIVGALLVVWWFLAAATSPEYYAVADGLITSWFGDLVMTLSVWALWFHALGGLRHLFWDAGGSMDVDLAEKLGVVMIVLSVVLTVLTLLIV